jgi:hypothetical protein
MIDTNQIAQAAQDAAALKAQLSPWLPALAVAAAWLGRELRNFNHWIFDLGEYVMAHGGLALYLKKLVWNPPPK